MSRATWVRCTATNGAHGPIPTGRTRIKLSSCWTSSKTTYSRRHVISAWNPSFIDEMALPPCHCCSISRGGGKLNCQLYQRSADTFLGVPFNISSYALLTMMVAQVVGLEPGEFVHRLGTFTCN